MENIKELMQKAIEALKKNFNTVRTGRANPALVERILVDVYGSNMQLQQLATISVPEARQLLITPFDKSTVQAIEKAIMTSDLGVTPQSIGNAIRINLPTLTEERRKDLVKVVKNYLEEGKVSLRNIRHLALDKIKKQEKDKEITEDESKVKEKELQDIINQFSLEMDNLLKLKEKEILEK